MGWLQFAISKKNVFFLTQIGPPKRLFEMNKNWRRFWVLIILDLSLWSAIFETNTDELLTEPRVHNPFR